MDTVVINFTAGFANSVLQFCTCYSLARELGYDILFDITDYEYSAYSYRLDYLNIPNYKKIIRDYRGNVADITEKMEIYPYSFRPFTYISKENYHSIKGANKFEKYENLVVKDWHSLFDRYNYFEKYKEELIPMLQIYNEEEHPNIKAFCEKIKGKVSVGIHVRRGGLIRNDYAVDIKDDYYRAAVSYFRKRLGNNVLFCVFSDDTEYAMKVFGYSDDIKYIKFLGYDDADFDEFMCLAKCDHRILNNNSTFSLVADFINTNPNKIAVLQGNMQSGGGLAESVKYYSWMLKLLLRKREEYKKQRIRRQNERHCKYFGSRKILKFGELYNYVDIQHNDAIDEFLRKDITIENSADTLQSIQSIELNYMVIGHDKEIKLKYKKFMAQYFLANYESALMLADNIWGYYVGNQDFMEKYAKCLKHFGFSDEADLLHLDMNQKILFIIDPGYETGYADCCVGMAELALCLSKMKFDVYLLEAPHNEYERSYIKEGDYFESNRDVNLGFRCFESENGIIGKLVGSCKDRCAVIISRNPSTFSDKVNLDNTKYVFWDLNDEYDTERHLFYQIDGNEKKMIEQADYILSPNSAINKYCDKKTIHYKNNVSHTINIDNRYKNIMAHRLSDRTINVAKAIVLEISI